MWQSVFETYGSTEVAVVLLICSAITLQDSKRIAAIQNGCLRLLKYYQASGSSSNGTTQSVSKTKPNIKEDNLYRIKTKVDEFALQTRLLWFLGNVLCHDFFRQ